MADAPTLKELWSQTVLALVANTAVTGAQLGYIRMLKPVAIVDGMILLSVGTQYAKDYIENNSGETLAEAIRNAAGPDRELRPLIAVDPSLEAHDDVPHLTEPIEPEPMLAPPRPAVAPVENPMAQGLNPAYTFESFVIGPSNRFAHAAAVAVADAPGKAYNPLFIYGGSGLGKTHLLHAIGLNALAIDPTLSVRYTTSEEFTNDFINAIREQKTDEFQRRYRESDVLLIDDIQFLQGKEQTMEEFFHTFNTLHKSHKQVVITSDVPPKQLGGFEDRLRSRFEWGLMTDVVPPDIETRIAILRHIAEREGMLTPDDVLEYIASKIHHNIRELEGALIRVTAYASLNHQVVDRTLAEVVLREIIMDDETLITASLIIGQTAKFFNLSMEELCGPSRSHNIAHPRQVAMYLCRELTELSLIKIGTQFGGRDHSTVLHADRKVRADLEQKPSVFNQVAELTRIVKQSASR
ncbi:MAG: chromosomal replication initiator protein DnaA [Micrococcales bacterium]|nr:chromosomal replication initiator protein DnaA [Micrococcales bacterium]